MPEALVEMHAYSLVWDSEWGEIGSLLFDWYHAIDMLLTSVVVELAGMYRTVAAEGKMFHGDAYRKPADAWAYEADIHRGKTRRSSSRYQRGSP